MNYKYKTSGIIFLSIILISISSFLHPLQAQDSTNYKKPSWWFGIMGAANLNQFNGSTQQLNDQLMAPVPFHTANSIGLFLAPTIEYYQPKSRWGIIMQLGYDSRRGVYKEVYSPCNCPRDLSTNLGYISFEPSIRFAPFKSNIYIYAGPRFAYNIQKSFTFQEKPNPDIPDQSVPDAVTSNFSHINPFLISMQVGAGYDIHLSNESKQNQWIISPFVAFHPYFGQSPRSIETWTINTLRLGAALKFGRGHEIKDISTVAVIVPIKEKESELNSKVIFKVNAPLNIPVVRKVREVFPLRNYIFFDLGNTNIPDRYVILRKDQVKNFKDDALELYAPKNLVGRSERQMIVYYNILNILGDRMGNNPNSVIKLVGSSESGKDDALAMSESIKKYLVDIFSISPNRIQTEGRDKPLNPSERPGGTKDLELLRAGDRRVTIETLSPSLLMEFQNGPEAPLKPIEIIDIQKAPVESYVTFEVIPENETIRFWNIEIVDETGNKQHFGPYTQAKVSIPGKNILGERTDGIYHITMTGENMAGEKMAKKATVHMVLWTPPTDEVVTRYSIIYEFNNAKAIAMYEKYIIDIILPKIPTNGKVMIHGYTDIIGDDDYNLKLSNRRANDVKTIMEYGLLKAGRSDVSFELFGFGEDETLTPFLNKYPEKRFYNRSVLIDILPAK